MTDKLVDDLLSDLKTALDVTPSAGFAAGVRARVEDRRATRGWAAWWPVAVGAAIAASAVIAIVMRSPSVPNDRPATVATVVPIETPAPIPSTPARPAGPGTPVAAAGPRVARPAASSVARAATPEPDLEVITNQGDVLRGLWARAQARRTAVEEVEPRPIDDASGDAMKQIVVPQMTIEPIVINALGSAGGSTPSVDRSAIRRVQAGRE